MKTISEMIAVMQAAERGEKIQYFDATSQYWLDTKPNWAWDTFDYRVKPKPKTRPFTRADMTDEVRWLRRIDEPSISNALFSVSASGLYFSAVFMRWHKLSEKYEWSPSMNGPWHPFTVEEA